MFTPDYPGDVTRAIRNWKAGIKSFNTRPVVEIIQTQRTLAFRASKVGKPWYGVGGSVQLTDVTVNGIWQQIVHEFDAVEAEVIRHIGIKQ